MKSFIWIALTGIALTACGTKGSLVLPPKDVANLATKPAPAKTAPADHNSPAAPSSLPAQ